MVKKLLTLTGDVTTIFKLQDVNLPLNNLKRSISHERQLNKNISFRTFGTTTLGVYNLLRNDLTHESMKFNG